jgi:hypothetical protein
MDLFAFMKPKLNRPIDVYETMQRVTIEALGKLGFGHKFGVRVGRYIYFFSTNYYNLKKIIF